MWLTELFTKTDSVAHSVLVIMLVSVTGLGLGQLKIKGVGLGIAWVLFAGLAFAHFGLTVNHEVLHFLREFGLILFVFTIGMQVGPGFFASLKRSGLPLNIAAVFIVLMGVAIGVVQWKYWLGGGDENLKAAVGLISGATTNTPSMAAGTAAFTDVEARRALTAGMQPVSAGATIGAAYAIAYPVGIFGVLFAMLAIRFIFRIDIAKEQRQLAASFGSPTLDLINLEVLNPALAGKAIEKIPTIGKTGVVITRLLSGKDVEVAGPDDILQIGDVITAVGPSNHLSDLELIVGKRTSIDPRAIMSEITAKRVLVSRKDAIGKSIEELALGEKYDVRVTRVLRSGFELPVTPLTRLQFGDRLMIVGESKSMPAVIGELGNSPAALDKPILAPILIGIAVGVIFGSIPITIPGLPAALKLGLAGGPLIVAIILSRIYRIGPLIWYMPNSANMMLREFGIVLFLACVGLLSGESFVPTFRAHGMQWILFGAAVTIVPVFLVGFVARAFFKMNYLTLTGLLAGSMTDPPALAFAQGITGSDASTVSYATVYPLVMLLRVMSAQIVILLLSSG